MNVIDSALQYIENLGRLRYFIKITVDIGE